MWFQAVVRLPSTKRQGYRQIFWFDKAGTLPGTSLRGNVSGQKTDLGKQK